MAWSDEFFAQQRRLTSKLKHLVLQAYMKEFAYHLGSVHPIVYYVDGFAGAGSYDVDETTREDGSPLLVARLAQQIKASSHPLDLRCLNVESNRKRFNSLEEATKEFRPHIVEKNYDSSFGDAIPDILARVGDAPAFFFIDPFGTKDIAFRNLLPIFERPSTTEVLITLHTDGIAKKAGWFGRENDSDPAIRNMAKKFTEHLAAALGISLKALRDGWRETGEGADTSAFERRALTNYLKRLRLGDKRFAFAKPFKVLYYRAQTLAESPVCFNLVFATRHEKGLFVMNDAMADALAAFYRDVYSSFFPTFVAERDQQDGRAAVRREIASQFASHPFTIDDVKRHCMQETDCLLKSGEYRKLILELFRAKELRKLDAGTPSNTNTRYEVARAIR